MAGKRKAEGIALLSLYNDDDEGDEEEEEDGEEEVEDEPQAEEQAVKDAQPSPKDEEVEADERHAEAAMDAVMEAKDQAQVEQLLFARLRDSVSPAEHPPAAAFSPVISPQPPADRSVGAAPHGFIVDYEHDEATLSPEPEEGEIMSIGRAVLGSDIQANNGFFQGVSPPVKGQVLSPDKVFSNQLDDQSEQLTSTTTPGDLGAKQDEAFVAAVPNLEEKLNLKENLDTNASETDPLADFLPPPPTTKCLDELQKKFAKYLALKNAGRSFNEELRKSKGYRNPDFLQRAVKYQEIDQIGSCFSKEVFDPHGYDPSDYYDALALEYKREVERKEQAKKQSQRIDFTHGGVQAAAVTSMTDKTKPVVPGLGGQNAVAGTTVPTSTGSQAVTGQDGRTNKKSKWDKVDTDVRAAPPLPSVTKTTIATASAHSALLTANAGAGYASFAQQKRKEAEERSRAIDKKVEKR